MKVQTALVGMSATIQEPWILSGDFNAILSPDDWLGSPVTTTKHRTLDTSWVFCNSRL